MIKPLALAATLLLPVALHAQDVVKGSINSAGKIEKPSRDFIMLQLAYEGWSKPDSVKTTGFSRAQNIYLCYDFPFNKKSNFSFAAGIGIGTSSMYLKNQEIFSTDSGATQARYVTETQDYKKYKFSTTYLEAPFEFRFFGDAENRNKGFKAALGLRVGTLLAAHTKGKLDKAKVVEKTNTKNFLESWRFAGTVRLGYGNFTVMGTYNLTKLYKENQGPAITPYSIGLCITGL